MPTRRWWMETLPVRITKNSCPVSPCLKRTELSGIERRRMFCTTPIIACRESLLKKWMFAMTLQQSSTSSMAREKGSFSRISRTESGSTVVSFMRRMLFA